MRRTTTGKVNPFRRTTVRPNPRPRREELPRIVKVRSFGSRDEVHLKLVAGQTPEDFDQAARALAAARGVARCQVRELAPNLVLIDYQRRNLLADLVACVDLGSFTELHGEDVDLRRSVVRAHRVRHRLVPAFTGRAHAERRVNWSREELPHLGT